MKQKTLLKALKNTSKMRRLLYISLLFYACLMVTPVQASITLPQKKLQLKTDSSSKISLRNFDQQQISKYSKQHDFNYTDEPENNLWSRFWSWVWEIIRPLFMNKYTGDLLKYAALTALIGLIIYAIIKVIGLDVWKLTRKAKTIAVPFSESPDNIHEINFAEEISKAIESTNYRLAVRLCYLLSLKKLSDRNLINWQPEKTNETYISEIKDTVKQEQFSRLTRQFEYIWYGEFFIDRENFSQIKAHFDEFNQGKI